MVQFEQLARTVSGWDGKNTMDLFRKEKLFLDQYTGKFYIEDPYLGRIEATHAPYDYATSALKASLSVTGGSVEAVRHPTLPNVLHVETAFSLATFYLKEHRGY